MECNKEEAFRAKDIAEKKLQNKDFVGARKFVLKAQQLYPEIENISQLLSVCDVHCSAGNKMFGSEMDWYGILQVEQTADDTLIKKQFRKYALLLHPDKNKFPGAEAAFKLIGEAHRVLLDKERRSIHDLKRRTSHKSVIPHHPPQQASRQVNVVRQSRPQNSFSGNPNSHVRGPNVAQQEQRKPAQPINGKETFWTLCLHCSVRYQYYKDVLGRALRCQSCDKSFVAYDSNAAKPGAAKSGKTQEGVPKEGVPKKPTSNVGTDAGLQAGQKAENNRSQKARQPYNGSNKVDRQEQGSKHRNANSQRGKRLEESSDSFISDSSSDSEDVELHEAGDPTSSQHFGSDQDRQTRRSNRNKRHVSYNENASDDEQLGTSSKKAKVNSLTEEKEDESNISGSAFGEESKKSESNMDDRAETIAGSTKNSAEADDELDSSLEPSPESTPVPTYHEYPDPEFCDFDEIREEKCFKVGQLWAAYDTADAMPRFYAKIKRIYSSGPGFSVQITWLEPAPDDEVGSGWAKAELPFSCGKFKTGETEKSEDRLMFSHVVSGWKSIGRKAFMIYPREGETWALFKNWDPKWYLLQEGERKFEYEFVEILSGYDGTVGIRVAPLGKLKGFASLFFRRDVNEIQIRPSELLRFSHMVPSQRMTGNERIDVPKGSFELDPASITMNLEEISPHGKNCVNNLSSKFAGEIPAVNVAGDLAAACRENDKGNKVERGNGHNGNVVGTEFPDPEFYNFDNVKSIDKIQVGQFWALYSDVDGLPKYFGYVKKVDHDPAFKLHITWLEPSYLPSDVILWTEKNMPVSCGQFKIKLSKTQTYSNTISFSHQIHAEPTGKRNIYSVYPRKGEVWALHKTWNPHMKPADLQTCDYNIVEVMDVNDSQIRVVVLERVDGFNTVFKPRSRDSVVTKEIPRSQILRFSHQIPYFRLTNEKGGSLKGYFELDAAAFPTKGGRTVVADMICSGKSFVA